MENNKKSKVLLIFSFCMIILYILILLMQKIGVDEKTFEEILSIIFAITFIIVGIFLINKWKKRNENCTYHINARIVDYKIEKGGYNVEIKNPIYEFYYNGEYRRITTAMNSLMTKPIGFESEFLINPNNPDEFIDVSYMPIERIIVFTLALLFITGGLFWLYMVFFYNYH